MRSESEWLTRKRRIDPRLNARGWRLAVGKASPLRERRVKAATPRAEQLTQAILARAFRGQLVPTEAELARRAGRECVE